MPFIIERHIGLFTEHLSVCKACDYGDDFMQLIMLRISTIILPTVMLTACAITFQAYEGDMKPDSEISILRRSGFTQLVELDGKHIQSATHMERTQDNPLGLAYKAVEMMPGYHTVTAHYHCEGLNRYEFCTTGDYMFKLCFTAQAGHRYTVYSEVRDRYGWIEDDESDQVIVDTNSSECN